VVQGAPDIKGAAGSWLVKERGLKISYPAVVKYTRAFRKKVPRAYHQLTFLPGEEAQVDWCYISIIPA